MVLFVHHRADVFIEEQQRARSARRHLRADEELLDENVARAGRNVFEIDDTQRRRHMRRRRANRLAYDVQLLGAGRGRETISFEIARKTYARADGEIAAGSIALHPRLRLAEQRRELLLLQAPLRRSSSNARKRSRNIAARS